MSAAGFLGAVLVGVVASLRVERAPPAFHSPPTVPGAAENSPEASRLVAVATPVGTPSGRVRDDVALSNLNADARAVLDALDGRWTDGDTRLHIDAKRLRGRVERGKAVPAQPLVIRHIGDLMIVADIGTERFFLYRRPDGLAISGATLPAPLELRRER